MEIKNGIIHKLECIDGKLIMNGEISYKYFICDVCGNEQSLSDIIPNEKYFKCVFCNKIICHNCKFYNIDDKNLEKPFCLECKK